MESPAEDGKSPVSEKGDFLNLNQSTTRHEKPSGKQGGPPPKAKYYLMTDREEVPWGKGEKNPGRGVKENLKPCAYERWEPY